MKSKVPGQIRAIAIPASTGFFFQTMFNVVDTFFAGQLGTTAVAALSLSFPMFILILAISRWIGAAASILISHAIGSGDNQARQSYFSSLMVVSILASVFVWFFGDPLVIWIFKIMGASGQYLDYAQEYMGVLIIGFASLLFPQMLNGILSAHEDTKSFRNAAVVSFVLNIFLDPLLIFGWGPISAYGVAGLAWATVLLNFWVSIYLYHKVHLLGYRLSIPKWNTFRKQIGEIFHHGVPAGFNMVTVSIGIFMITYFISGFGEAAVAAYGIATRIEQIALLPTIGLNIAALSLVGQNMGAKKYENISYIYALCLRWGAYLVLPLMVLMWIFSPYLIGLFDSNPEVVAIGSYYLRIAVVLFWAYVVLFISVSALQGMKKPFPPLIIGVLRQIIVPGVVWYILIYVFNMGIGSIWWSLFIIIWLSAAVSFLWSRNIMKKLG